MSSAIVGAAVSARQQSQAALQVDAGDRGDVLFGFADVSIASVSPPRELLSGVSGYVHRSGITAVLGASSSGKTVLLKSLSGRISQLAGLEATARNVTLDGHTVNLQHSVRLPLVYIPQDDDALIGVLTPREALGYAARLKQPHHPDHDRLVTQTLQRVGLEDVADNLIGTAYRRGLSGGQKRRCTVALELVGEPRVLFLDEPTSGLDATRAVGVMGALRDLVRESQEGMGIILTIHQPNVQLLSHFDHILVLANGGSAFFGTLPQALVYFAELGYPVPQGETPSDHFLMLADPHARRVAGHAADDLNLVAQYATSNLAAAAVTTVLAAAHVTRSNLYEVATDGQRLTTNMVHNKAHLERSRRGVFLAQYNQLVHRFFVIARRDLSLFYLQILLQLVYGILMGGTFWMLPAEISPRINDKFSASVWLIALSAMIHVFKVFFQTDSFLTLRHERANNTYSPLAYFFAELTLTVSANVLFYAGPIAAYPMTGFPASTFGFFLLVSFFINLTAEAIGHLVVQFTAPAAALGVLVFQAIILLVFPFAAGIFIRDDQVPAYWTFVPPLSMFQHGTNALVAGLWTDIEYTCREQITVNGTCLFSGVSFGCDVGFDYAENRCVVSGPEVVARFKRINPDKWASLGYIILLGVVCRILVAYFYIHPVNELYAAVKRKFTSSSKRIMLRLTMEQSRLGRIITSLQHDVAVLSLSTDKADTDHSQARNRDSPAAAVSGDNDVPVFTKTASTLTNALGHDDQSPRLVFRNVHVTLKDKSKKAILHNVSGVAVAGRVCALMGPSGAGKTTLLNALAARAPYAQVDGVVTYGNSIFTKQHLTYVPQFSNINPVFTPRELLTYTAKLKLVETADERDTAVAALLEILGLTDTAHIPCARLTGGQLKRVSIGIGLITRPSCLFLDEPTTGLDSSAAYTITSYINRIARRLKVVVICTMHQPSRSVFNQVDDLILLAPGGHLAYFGAVANVPPYFASLGVAVDTDANVADTVLNLVSEPPAAAGLAGSISWNSLYTSSAFASVLPVVLRPQHDCRPPTCSDVERYSTMTAHLLKSYYRTPQMYTFRAVIYFVMAVFLGTLYLDVEARLDRMQDVSGAAFFAILTVLFLSISNASTLVYDRSTVRDAYASDLYGIGTWTLAQMTASLPYVLVASAIFQIPFHFLTSLNLSTESFVFAFLMNVVLQLFMEAVVWCIVEMVNNSMLAVTFSAVSMGTFFMYSGFFVAQSSMPDSIAWLPWITPTRYMLRGSLTSYIRSRSYYDPISTVSVPGSHVLEQIFEIGDESQWVNLAIGLAFTIAFRAQHMLLMWVHFRKLGSSVGHTSPAKASPTGATEIASLPDSSGNAPLTHVSSATPWSELSVSDICS